MMRVPYCTFWFADNTSKTFMTRGDAADFFGVERNTISTWLCQKGIQPDAKRKITKGVGKTKKAKMRHYVYDSEIVEVVFDDGKIDEYPSFAEAAESLGVTPQELNNYKRVRGLGVLSVHKIKEN